jgi:hypothetical protein
VIVDVIDANRALVNSLDFNRCQVNFKNIILTGAHRCARPADVLKQCVFVVCCVLRVFDSTHLRNAHRPKSRDPSWCRFVFASVSLADLLIAFVS